MSDTGGHEEVAAALAALNAARGRFIAVVGHELRTPVTTLRGLAEELPEADEAEMRELAPAIVRNARRVEKLLDDLLLATDITTVLPVGTPEPIDVVSTAQAIWDSFEEDADLRLEGDESATALLRPNAGDVLLERVLDNARRYGSEPFVLQTATKGDRIHLTVSSQGATLVPDDVQLAFELFYRGEAAVTSAPGFGLGLPVARAIARQDGGDLVIEPRREGGLDVRIELPAAP
jgi:signal transduction histidine kinase